MKIEDELKELLTPEQQEAIDWAGVTEAFKELARTTAYSSEQLTDAFKRVGKVSNLTAEALQEFGVFMN